MDHYPGITPSERYHNDLLNEMRECNNLMRQMLERNAQAPEPKVIKQIKPVQRRKKAQ